MVKNAKSNDKQKLFRIGQVAKMTGIQQFVLRFWEKEFNLKLPKAKSGHRFYRHEDVQKILTIKRLLYTEGFTIKGAMHKLAWNETDLQPMTNTSQKITPREANYRKVLIHLRGDLQQLLKDLN